MGTRVAVALLALSMPAFLVLAGLALAGLLNWRWALPGAVLVALLQLPILISHFQHLDTLLVYLGRFRRGGSAQIGMVQDWEIGSPFLTPRLAPALKETARERERQQRQVEEAMAANAAILSNLPDALLLLSENRRILSANPAAEELLGPELSGRDLVEVLRHPDLLSALDLVFGGRTPEPVLFDLPGRIDRHLSAHMVALRMPTFKGTTAVVALHDLTAVHRAEQLRADFVANASHELRTPLSSLSGFIETLLGAAKDDPQALETFLPIMHEQAQRMARLVEDLLSLSRIELREHAAPSGSADLGAILKVLRKGLVLRAQERDMTIDLAVEGLPTVAGDQDELIQVFQNLLDNALKYGRDGTAVRVEGRIVSPQEDATARRLEATCVAVAVQDQGDGIAREHLSRLTERFYRVDTARSRQLGGTGLGLAIVKHIVNRHRGLLQIDSEPGKGSTFTVFIPVAAVAADEGV